jgi:DNA-binding transcriptional regulator YdaS (Cro superfamily)
MKKTGLLRAIEIAGSQSELARRIGVGQTAVWYWLHMSRYGVPAEYVSKIEQVTGVVRTELRPDLWEKAR